MAPGKIEVTAADGSKQVHGSKKYYHSNRWPGKAITEHADRWKKNHWLPRSHGFTRTAQKHDRCGSGAIGFEFAYFYNSMGTKVTIVEFMPRIVPVEDEDISKELEKQFKKQGMTIMTNSEVTKVDTSGNGVKATVKTADGEVSLEADILLSAVGVVANIENIGLEELGVKTEKGKIIVDANQQTNVPGIYAIGDCTPGQALAHVASKEGINAAEHLCGSSSTIHGL